MKKKKLAIAAVMLILVISVAAGYYMFGALSKEDKLMAGYGKMPQSLEQMYSMFLCPCCGKALDKRNICCGSAQAMINYIDSLAAQKLTKGEIISKMVEKYGINSVAEPQREEVREYLKQSKPGMMPTQTLVYDTAVGQKAIDFTLQDIEGKNVKLSDYKGKRIVLFFNEGSMCYPACWNQMGEFAKDTRFNNENTITFSIVPDQNTEWQEITRKVPSLSNARILFDSARTISETYDVLSLPSSMHKGSYPGHTYFVIDKEGVIRYTLDDPKMAIQNDLLAGELEKIK